LSDPQRKVMDEVIATLKAQGAVIVDPADIPSVTTADSVNNFLNWGQCSGLDNAKGKDSECSVDLKYGMKRDFNTWLKSLGDRAPVKTLAELRAWNTAHQKAGAIKYGQSQFDISDEMDVDADRGRYEADRAKDVRLGGAEGIDAAMKANRLDALLFPGVSSAGLAAKPGYPSVTVPYALLPITMPTGANAFPTGFTPRPGPFNVTFTGGACSEPKLIQVAFAFEQATKKRHAPPLFP
jgi:amidase